MIIQTPLDGDTNILLCRGRPRLRWEKCVKIDERKAGEEEDWKKKTRDGGVRKNYQMRR